MRRSRLAASAWCALVCACNEQSSEQPVATGLAIAPPPAAPATSAGQDERASPAPGAGASEDSPVVRKALAWLVEAQQEDGGFGAGSHAKQDERRVRAVPTDPATTAVAAIALLRAGARPSPAPGDALSEVLGRATEFLLQKVESAPAGPQITTLAGTQPQAKMGANVDTALTAQYLARLLQELKDDAAVRPRVLAALAKCLHKIEAAQASDGSWAGGGWAPVLQSAQMCTALELAQAAGCAVDAAKLAQARDYQKAQVDAAGRVRTTTAAGVALYASVSNMRANVAESRAAAQLVEDAKRQGQLAPDAKVEESTLVDLGVGNALAKKLASAYQGNTAAKARAFDADLLEGFGNNGGEEFLSYQMQSESLAIDGGAEWSKWNDEIHRRLAKVQNQDGSWSGHHCITSPVFCTATAIACLTAGRDVDWLRRTSKLAMR